MIVTSYFFIFIMFITSTVSAQTGPDFSGTWIQDKEKSGDFYKKFNVTTVITQTPQTISVKTTFADDSGKEMVTRESSFNLDGKEVSKQNGGRTLTESAVWSADRKTLTTKSTGKDGGGEYGSSSAYTLSENGLILTIKTVDVNPMGQSVVQVFNKK